MVTGINSGDLHLGRRTFLAAWLQIMQAWYVSLPDHTIKILICIGGVGLALPVWSCTLPLYLGSLASAGTR